MAARGYMPALGAADDFRGPITLHHPEYPPAIIFTDGSVAVGVGDVCQETILIAPDGDAAFRQFCERVRPPTLWQKIRCLIEWMGAWVVFLGFIGGLMWLSHEVSVTAHAWLAAG
jgi:hypothetical protein